ncbi:MAG: TonB family protein [Bacteroidales bacterium]|nr:TonB family protein [Bacteroidales bacterium]MCF8458445.1 TonB family protein [Bacteroidales bacterium]
METKKTPQADLEKKRAIFLQTGFVIVLALLLLAFEWTSSEGKTNSLGELGNDALEEEQIPITRQEEVPPPPPPPPPQVTEVINIVEDDVEIEDEIDIEDTEADQEMQVEIMDVEEEEEEATVFTIVEDMPIFMPSKCKTKEEGELELRKYIATSIKYPEIARENGIQGRVYISFIVSTKGKVTNVKIARGIDPALDKEAIRVIEGLPDFSPGKQRGKAVKVSYTVPINFKLG